MCIEGKVLPKYLKLSRVPLYIKKVGNIIDPQTTDVLQYYKYADCIFNK